MRVLVKKVNEFLEKVGKRPCRGICSTVCVFSCTFFNSDHFAFADFGAIYAGNKSGCDDGGL